MINQQKFNIFKNYDMRKEKLFVSPVGELVYGHLKTPIQSCNNSYSYYLAKLALPKDDMSTVKLMADIDSYISNDLISNYKILSKAYKLSARDITDYTVNPVPYQEEYDDNGNITNNIVFKFKKRACKKLLTGTLNNQYFLFDKNNNTIKLEDVGLWRGSSIQISFKFHSYSIPPINGSKTILGVYLHIYAIKVLNDINGNTKNTATNFGF